MDDNSTCLKCERNVVFYRRYSNERLCSFHFKESLVEKTRRTVSKYQMFRYGETIAVGLSGGKDSTSLLKVLSEICKEHGSQLYAITIDEGIEGYRDESLDYSRRLTDELNVPLIILSYKDLYGFTLEEALENRRAKVSSCAICGPLRRRGLDLGAKKVGANVIATAHNLDDVVQTFFINLLSGDIERIKWLSPNLQPRDEFVAKRVKPFMEIYEEELALFAYLSEIPFQSARCPHSDEGVRSEIRAWLNSMEARHAGVKHSTLKSILTLADGLRSESHKSFQLCRSCGSPSSGTICNVCQTVKLVAPNK